MQSVLLEIAAELGQPMPVARIKAYWNSLKEMDRMDFDYCTKVVRRNSHFMPTSGDWWKASRDKWR
ncbi:MAG: hypothetical protein JSR92_19775 [Proteobacteria bacterium]|nr:hypothetical protein [Pseudomonadota bacterium]